MLPNVCGEAGTPCFPGGNKYRDLVHQVRRGGGELREGLTASPCEIQCVPQATEPGISLTL